MNLRVIHDITRDYLNDGRVPSLQKIAKENPKSIHMACMALPIIYS